MTEFQILHQEETFLICLKPPRVLSTDEPGGIPELCRHALGDPGANIRTVHRLDRVVSGIMVLARNKRAASELSRQIREGDFDKEYLAVVHGELEAKTDTLIDLLLRNKQERKTYVVHKPGKDVQEAILQYEHLDTINSMSKARIKLITGRTHQIRCQFSHRNHPLVGDQKYSTRNDTCEIALWSHKISFLHPVTGERLTYIAPPPDEYPWNEFGGKP